MKVLVTGATGFIGRHLVERLAGAGDEVTCLVRTTSNREPLERHGVQFAEGDITDPESLREAVRGAGVVYHLAALLKAPWRPTFVTDNVQGTSNLASACAAQSDPPLLVACSSLAAAGPARNGSARTESQPEAPVSRYGRVKLSCDRALGERAADVPTTVVRPPMVFGEGDPTTLKLFRLVAKGWHLVPSLRSHRVSMIHAADLAEALVLAGERGERLPAAPEGAAPGTGVYFAAAPDQPSYADLGRWVGVALGRERVRVVRIPVFFTWLTAAVSELIGRLRDKPTFLNLDKAREARAGSWICGAEKAARDLGFRPAKPVAERLAQTGAWYRREGWL